MSAKKKIIWLAAALACAADLYLYSATVLYSSMQAIIWPYTAVKSSVRMAFSEQCLYLGIVIFCLAKSNPSLLFKIFTFVFALSRFIIDPILTGFVSGTDVKGLIAVIIIIAAFSDFRIIKKRSKDDNNADADLKNAELRRSRKRALIAVIVFVVLIGYGCYRFGYIYIDQEVISGLKEIDAHILLDNVMRTVRQGEDENLTVKTNEESGEITISHIPFDNSLSLLEIELSEKEAMNPEEYYMWAWYERYRSADLDDSKIISIGKKAYFTWASKDMNISYVGHNGDDHNDALNDELNWLIEMGT